MAVLNLCSCSRQFAEEEESACCTRMHGVGMCKHMSLMLLLATAASMFDTGVCCGWVLPLRTSCPRTSQVRILKIENLQDQD